MSIVSNRNTHRKNRYACSQQKSVPDREYVFSQIILILIILLAVLLQALT